MNVGTVGHVDWGTPKCDGCGSPAKNMVPNAGLWIWVCGMTQCDAPKKTWVSNSTTCTN